MGRFLLGLAVGAGLVLLVGLVVLAEREHHWRYMGELNGRWQAFEFVEREFGVLEKGVPTVPGTTSFSHKTDDLVVVEVNGVRTIRVRK